MLEAVEYMQHKHAYGVPLAEDDHWDGPNWTIDDVQLYIQGTLGRCVLLIDDFVIDATSYMGEHVGIFSHLACLIIDLLSSLAVRQYYESTRFIRWASRTRGSGKTRPGPLRGD